MKFILIWLIVFIVFYLLYLFFVILRKKKISKFSESTYIKYLTRVYKLDIKKLNIKKAAHLISLGNAFIVATTFLIIFSIKNYFLMLGLTVLVVIPLILIVYHIIGKCLKKGEK